MSFYTADWVRKYVKQEHEALQKHLTGKDKDFRSFIDASLPFSLYLDIGEIRDRILKPNATFISELASLLKLEDPNLIISILDKAYIDLINSYSDNPRFKKVDSIELKSIIDEFNNTVVSGGNIQSAITKFFSNTIVVTNLCVRNVRTFLIFPKFNTVSNDFGKRLKELIDLSPLSDYIDDELGDSPRNIFKNFLNKNFGKLQNLGHAEVDVISTTSKEIKRGLVSPRLLQALVSLPKETKVEPIVKRFSKETGQANTRIIVRKKFADSKMVLEILVESGFMIGIPESQADNLTKAPLEKQFNIGANLTAAIKANPNIILDLETSKSIKQYAAEAVLESIKNGRAKPYSSTAIIDTKTKITRTKTVLDPKPQKAPSTSRAPKLPKPPSASVDLSSLLVLIQHNIAAQVEKNMGTGNRSDVLNYRTGRFANSVKVERLTQSKEGMISAFYSYMKYPYATFSEGGRQQYPRSRDPKTLISKSIKEIAAEKVAARMRAVLV